MLSVYRPRRQPVLRFDSKDSRGGMARHAAARLQPAAPYASWRGLGWARSAGLVVFQTRGFFCRRHYRRHYRRSRNVAEPCATLQIQSCGSNGSLMWRWDRNVRKPPAAITWGPTHRGMVMDGCVARGWWFPRPAVFPVAGNIAGLGTSPSPGYALNRAAGASATCCASLANVIFRAAPSRFRAATVRSCQIIKKHPFFHRVTY